MRANVLVCSLSLLIPTCKYVYKINAVLKVHSKRLCVATFVTVWRNGSSTAGDRKQCHHAS